MNKNISFHNKSLSVTLSEAAAAQSIKLQSPLVVEIQIYFSCLHAKRLAFYSAQQQQGIWQLNENDISLLTEKSQQISDNVYIRFNAVMTESCTVADNPGPPPVTDFIIKNPEPYVPSWLNLDFTQNSWTGEYGWPSSVANYSNTKQIRDGE